MSDAKATAATVDRWEVPAIDGAKGQGLMTASRLQDLQQEAYDEAFAQGLADGLAAGEKQLAERVARLDSLLAAQAAPLAELDELVEKQLVDLAMRATRKLFRREMKLDPGHVIGVVRDAVGLLPVASRDVRVHLHPDDADLIREALHPSDGDSAWALFEDPLIDRGGCRVTTETSQVDAENQTRLNALIASIAGDERNS
jgi:flagellar assembly protein FliH